MTRPYSEDLRERIVRVVESGTSRNAAAKRFDASISFVVKLMQRWHQRGTIKTDKYGGWKKAETGASCRSYSGAGQAELRHHDR